MKAGDFVLIMAHHYPFALVKVDGPYNYIRKPKQLYPGMAQAFPPGEGSSVLGDWVTNAHSWKKISMTNTISRLDDRGTESYQLIEQWLRAR